jgi:hypothetical protein
VASQLKMYKWSLSAMLAKFARSGDCALVEPEAHMSLDVVCSTQAAPRRSGMQRMRSTSGEYRYAKRMGMINETHQGHNMTLPVSVL